jgi:hypothetical protein
VDVERPEQELAEVLNGLESPVQPIGQARPRLAELSY